MADITSEYINNAISNNEKCIIVINNGVYDITEYLKLHPGGEDILTRLNGRDATNEFNDINHSKYAIKLMREYEIGTISDAEKSKLRIDKDYINKSYDTTITLEKINQRLNTHEDILYLHKITGIIGLGNMIYRMYTNIILQNHSSLTDYSLINTITILANTILALSSLGFHVPNNRATAGKNFEYKEMRLHSIVFSLRSLIPILLNYMSYFDNTNFLHRLGNIIIWHSLADLSTYFYSTKENGTTIRNSDFKGNTIKEYIIRVFLSSSQIFAIAGLLGLHNNYDFKSNYNDLIYLIIIPVQMAAFLMTLYKKELITGHIYNIMYGLSLLSLYTQISYTDIQFINLSLLLTNLRFLGINKYVLYVGFSTLAELLRRNNIQLSHIFTAINVISFVLIVLYPYIKETYINNETILTVLESKHNDKNNTCIITFNKSKKLDIPNGRHIVLQYKDIIRSYTPINVTRETVTIYIKVYKDIPSGGVMSQYLSSLKMGDKITIKNIKGNNIYTDNKFHIRNNEICVNNKINMICAGTGFTPIMRIIQASSNINVLHSIRNVEDIPEILKDCNISYNYTITKYIKDAKHKYMSRINKEMIQETCDMNGIFLVCGSYTFNREIKELLLQLNINNANIIEY